MAALDGKLDNAGALFGLAQISRLKGETRETAIYLNRVSSLIADSKSPEFLYKFALEALRVGLSDEAKAALERSLELKPNEPAYLLALGIAFGSAKFFDVSYALGAFFAGVVLSESEISHKAAANSLPALNWS